MLSQSGTFNTKNNFTLVRIYLSLSVVFFHCYELSRQPELTFLPRFFNGETAVEAFFIISGYLVMKSYYRSRSLNGFFTKRIRRIYPAYGFIILLCALGGALVTTYTVTQYFSSPGLYKYLISNLCFLNFIEPGLPGVFTDNAFTAINGSLWTLKIEVAYYLLVPLVAFVRTKMNAHLVYAILFLSSIGYFMGMKYLYTTTHNYTYLFLSRQIPGQLFYFVLGAWIIELEKNKRFIPVIKWLGIPAIAILWLPLPLILQCSLQAVAVFFCAYAVPAVNYPYREEDISYGLYIYHFPVIQALVYYQLYSQSPFTALVLTVLVVFILAVLSWKFIEKPFIKKKPDRHLVKLKSMRTHQLHASEEA